MLEGPGGKGDTYPLPFYVSNGKEMLNSCPAVMRICADQKQGGSK